MSDEKVDPPEATKTRNRRRGQPRRQSNQSQNATIRVALRDLPPDRQAEIAGRRIAGADERRQRYRPQIPEILRDIELHTFEVRRLYRQDFNACNEYAVAIDYVARDRLKDTATYNGYLAEFDAAIDALTKNIASLHQQYELRSNGGMTTSRKPHTEEYGVQSRRSMQLFDQYKAADDVVRMVQFLAIYAELAEDEAQKAITSVQDDLERCVRTLRSIKLKCFRRIVENERLKLRVVADTPVEDLIGARAAASARDGGRARTVRRSRAQDQRIDPAAPASEPMAPPAPSVPDVEASTEAEPPEPVPITRKRKSA